MNSKAFTLIELLVVIVVIGIISAIIYISLNSAQMEARDAVRKVDVESYAKALLIEKSSELNKFPEEEVICCLDADEESSLFCSNVRNSNKIKQVLTAIPVNPHYDGTTNNCYRYISNGQAAALNHLK